LPPMRRRIAMAQHLRCVVFVLLLHSTVALRLLVAGGSGYLGRQVCREAIQLGYSVTSLSRRGENPLPGTLLDQVEWVKGSASDSALLERLAYDADAFVHTIGLLLDAESGLAGLNFLTSGSRSVPAEGATYDSEMRGTALALLDAAQRTKSGAERPFVFVSAAEAGWSENTLGSTIEGALRERDFFLPRYLDAKRAVEAALVEGASAASVRPIIARPSFMWDPSKVDILPLLPVWYAGHALGIGGGTFSSPLRVEIAGAAIASLVEESMRGVVGSSQLAESAPLAIIRRPGPIDTLTSGLASIARLPFGTTVASALADQATTSGSGGVGVGVDVGVPSGGDGGGDGDGVGARPPPDSLRLYAFEGCPFCRRVREVAVYLDLEYTMVPCARESRNRGHVALAATAQDMERPTFPYLEDDAAGVTLFESEDIVNHLMATYGTGLPLPPPSDYFLPSALVTGWLPSLLRPTRGGAVEPLVARRAAPPPPLPIELYDYDGNQFCRLVREALCELDLLHIIRSVGKQSPRRQQLMSLAGKSTAPYMVDPNTGKAMGESADIVEYLYREYASSK